MFSLLYHNLNQSITQSKVIADLHLVLAVGAHWYIYGKHVNARITTLNIPLTSSKIHVSISGLWAKFGLKYKHNWPMRSYHKCIRAGLHSMLFYFKLYFSCVCNINIFLFQSLCVSKIKACFHMKRRNTTYQRQLNSQ